jgi:hypothetical protein
MVAWDRPARLSAAPSLPDDSTIWSAATMMLPVKCGLI